MVIHQSVDIYGVIFVVVVVVVDRQMTQLGHEPKTSALKCATTMKPKDANLEGFGY